MVWSSSSSSISSSGDTNRANRRNSIFYIDPGFSTKQEIPSQPSSIETKIDRMEVVDEEVVLRNKKHYQNEQFNTIVKALLYFESKLKSDQKNIRQILFEKDEIINRQWNEIINFKKRYNDTTKIEEIDDVAKYCPKCRKNYYLLEKKSGVIFLGTCTILFCVEK